MRIPANSTFTKELSKQFKQIFNKDMPLCELTTTIGKHNGQETSKVANAVRQVHNERKGFVAETVSTKGKEKSYSLETASD